MSVPVKMMAMIKKEEARSYVYEEIDVSEPVGDEVLITVDLVAICGSDIALYDWNDVARVIATPPFIPGHEATGVVVKCGPESHISVGSRVAVENHFYCGSCSQCKSDRQDICQRMGQYGHGKKTMHGGCCQYSIVSSKYCYVITSDISKEEAVLMEPLGVSHNAIEQLEVKDQDVLITGCGPIGLFACSLAKALGASRVLAADIDVSRLELAKIMGADVCINTAQQNLKEVIMKETNDNGVSRLCEMSGAQPIVNNMFSLLKKGGHIVMVGLPKHPLHVENPLPDIVFKSLQLRTIHGRRIFHTWQECERLLSDKAVDVHPVVSHSFPMSKYEDAFTALFSGTACKIIMDPHN